MTPRVYVVLLNWNGWRDTIVCLESVLRLDHADYRIVICDNASTDDSVSRIRDWAAGRQAPDIAATPLGAALTPAVPKPLSLVEYSREVAETGGETDVDERLVLVHTGANLGFAGGCNVGIRYAMARGDASFVWLLNNDTVVQADALSELVSVASRDASIGLVGSTLCFFDAPESVQALGGGSFNPARALTSHIGEGQKRRVLSVTDIAAVEAKMEFVVGASMLASRAFLDTVGPMQDDYFLYFEEMDWAERARRCDPPFRLAYAPGSIVYHKVGASVGNYARSLLSVRYYTRNRLRFLKRFYPSYLGVARLRLVRESAGLALRGRFAAARMMFRMAMSPVRI